MARSKARRDTPGGQWLDTRKRRKSLLQQRVRSSLTSLTFRGMTANSRLYELFSLPVISTGRSFAYYRRIFFDNRSESALLSALEGQRIVDVGCGLTPYVSDSMFQVCRKAGIDFYGVDLKLAEGFKIGPREVAMIRAVGSRGRIHRYAVGLDKAIGAPADELPFEDESVDLVLSCFLLYAWIQNEDVLEKIYREFDRVLNPGGEVRIYPAPDLCINRIRHTGLQQVMGGFEIDKAFYARWSNPAQYPPAYTMILRKE